MLPILKNIAAINGLSMKISGSFLERNYRNIKKTKRKLVSAGNKKLFEQRKTHTLRTQILFEKSY